MKARLRSCQNGVIDASAGCNPKWPSRSMAALRAAPGGAMAMVGPQDRVVRIAVGHHDVEAVDRAAQKNNDQPSLGFRRGRGESMRAPSGNTLAAAAAARKRRPMGSRTKSSSAPHEIRTAEQQTGLKLRRSLIDDRQRRSAEHRSPSAASDRPPPAFQRLKGSARRFRAPSQVRARAGASSRLSDRRRAPSGRWPPPRATAKEMRRVIASGLSHASSVHLNPSGV